MSQNEDALYRYDIVCIILLTHYKTQHTLSIQIEIENLQMQLRMKEAEAAECDKQIASLDENIALGTN